MIHLCTHVNPDGDALGSVFGCFHALLADRTEATVHLWGSLPRWFADVHAFLGSPPYTTEPVTAGATIWLLDAPHVSRCGEGNVPADAILELLVDHHPRNEETQVSEDGLVVHALTASSACELVARHVVYGSRLNGMSASWLALGMRTDTLGFSTATTSEKTHAAMAEVLRYGARASEVAAIIHRSSTMNHLRFQAEVLRNAEWVADRSALVMTVSRKDRHEYGIGENDVKAVFAPTGTLNDTDMVVLVIEADDGATLISARSVSVGRAQAYCQALGGGGHPQASGARVAGGVAYKTLIDLL